MRRGKQGGEGGGEGGDDEKVKGRRKTKESKDDTRRRIKYLIYEQASLINMAA